MEESSLRIAVLVVSPVLVIGVAGIVGYRDELLRMVLHTFDKGSAVDSGVRGFSITLVT